MWVFCLRSQRLERDFIWYEGESSSISVDRICIALESWSKLAWLGDSWSLAVEFTCRNA